MGPYPNCEIKLCDLEVSRVIQEDEDIREIIGTPDYVGKIIGPDPRKNDAYARITVK